MLSWHGSLLENKRDASGLEYKRNRVYDPSTGRFTQEDPIGLAGGLNSYCFANGDPLNFGDPFGLAADTIRVETSDPNAAALEGAYTAGKQAVSADRDNPDSKAVLEILGNYEKSRRVFLLRTGSSSGSEFGGYLNGTVSVDVENLRQNGLGRTTMAFVVIHELGHAYANLSLGYPSGSTEQIARLLFENSARRGPGNQSARWPTSFTRR